MLNVHFWHCWLVPVKASYYVHNFFCFCYCDAISYTSGGSSVTFHFIYFTFKVHSTLERGGAKKIKSKHQYKLERINNVTERTANSELTSDDDRHRGAKDAKYDVHDAHMSMAFGMRQQTESEGRALLLPAHFSIAPEGGNKSVPKHWAVMNNGWWYYSSTTMSQPNKMDFS